MEAAGFYSKRWQLLPDYKPKDSTLRYLTSPHLIKYGYKPVCILLLFNYPFEVQPLVSFMLLCD